MSEDTIKVKLLRLDPAAGLPTQATAGSAGFDLVSIEKVSVPINSWAMIRTGLAMEIPPGYEAQVRPRSGLAANHGVTVLNSPGTIDSDYRGEIRVILSNHGVRSLEVNPGDRIAQIVIQQLPSVTFEVVESISETSRGAGGFGHTGQ